MKVRHVRRYWPGLGCRVTLFNFTDWKRGLTIEIDIWRHYFGVSI